MGLRFGVGFMVWGFVFWFEVLGLCSVQCDRQCRNNTSRGHLLYRQCFAVALSALLTALPGHNPRP